MTRKWKSALFAALFTVAAGGAATGQGYPDQNYPDTSGDELSVQQTVARLSYINGDVSFARGDDPDNWQSADPNVPMTIGDRAWTADGRLELQIHGGNVVRLANQTDLTALNLTEDTKQFSMSSGVGSFRIRRLYEGEIFEVDTPNAAVNFETPGDYRIDVRPDGDTRVQVRSGRATVAAGGGQIPIDGGEGMMIEGDQNPRYDFIPAGNPDGWDGWVSDREARYRNVRSYQYVSRSISGVEDLDTYGSWQRIPSYGWSWTPASVTVGWAPYRAGRWIWQDPWGWTWVSTEPWGWAPYHYGRWVNYTNRWFWVPVAPAVAVVPYRPALVAFVGGGPGFGVTAGFSTDYVGWFPLAPHDPFVPWWGRTAVNVTTVNVTNVTYVNRTYVTVVNQQTFVQSGVVTTNYVRDQSVIQRIERAPVVRGAIPVVPTQQSIRVSTREVAAARPPQPIAQRTVVTRVAPPPAPPRFDEKVAVIRQQRGAPVDPLEAQKIATQRGQSRPAVSVRPAAATQQGKVDLQPRGQTTQVRQPQPVAPPSGGRQLATSERTVAPLTAAPAQPRGRQVREEAQQREPSPAARPGAPARDEQVQREAPARQTPPPAREVQREAPPQRTAPPAREAQREREVPPPDARSQRNTAQERETPPPRATRPAPPPPEARSHEERQTYATPEHGRRPTPRMVSEPPPPRERQVAPPPSERSQPQPRNEPETHNPDNRGHEKSEGKPTPKPSNDRSRPRPTPKPD